MEDGAAGDGFFRGVGRDDDALPDRFGTGLAAAEHPVPAEGGEAEGAGVVLAVAGGMITTRVGAEDGVLVVGLGVAGDPEPLLAVEEGEGDLMAELGLGAPGCAASGEVGIGRH